MQPGPGGIVDDNDDARAPQLRIAHLSDTHLGYRALGKTDLATGRNARSLDVEAAFTQAIDQIIAARPDFVLHSGDVFHTPRPAWQAISHFVAQMRRLEQAGIPAVVLAGNHDTPRLRASGSVFTVLETALPGTLFATGYEQQDISLGLSGDRFVHLCCIPSGVLSSPKPFRATTKLGAFNILLTHGIVSRIAGQKRAPEIGEEQVPDEALLTDYDYIALGDWHAWQKVRPNAWYAGSTERFGWSDREADPGWLLVEALGPGELRVEHHLLATRAMNEVGPIDAKDLSRDQLLDAVLRTVLFPDRDALCRVVIANAPRLLRGEITKLLTKELGEFYWHVAVAFAEGGRITEAQRLLTLDDEYELPSVMELFEEWLAIERERMDPEVATRMSTRGRQALEAAVERQRMEAGAVE